MSRLRSRGAIVVLAAGLAVLLLAVGTRTWLTAQVADPLAGAGHVDVSGGRAVPLVPALALVALAGGGALTIARRIGQIVVLTALALAGAGAALAAGRVLTDPVSAARPAVAEATGLTTASVTASTASVSMSAWPLVAVVLAALIVAVAVLGWTARSGWQVGRRFERAAAQGEAAAGDADTVVPPAGRPDGASPAAAADDWDALSRGDDPTSGPGGGREPDQG
ncbi:MAG TPA: Trp biosynthesis-associated membrane protein [Nocardioidaceae bacterium]|nr:Trp biosynthesis-associated membrane protein [Nocardioidaceae bacterium]